MRTVLIAPLFAGGKGQTKPTFEQRHRDEGYAEYKEQWRNSTQTVVDMWISNHSKWQRNSTHVCK